MKLINFHLPILLILILSNPSLSTELPSQVKVAFPKHNTLSGWQTYDPSKLSAGTQVKDFSSNQYPEYSAFVSRKGGFSYHVDVQPGTYEVKLGFFEPSSGEACAKGKRVFAISANGHQTGAIDIYSAAGCNAPHSVTIRHVKVFTGKLFIIAIPVAGYPPVLSNFQVTQRKRPRWIKYFRHSSNSLTKIYFSKHETIPGWHRYDFGLSPGVTFDYTTRTVAPPIYRSRAVKIGGFTYVRSVSPGQYRIFVGFAEISLHACKSGSRVFKVYVNNRSTGNLDVYKQAGCEVPLVRIIENIRVRNDKRLVFKFVSVSGLAPMVSTIRIQRVESPSLSPSTSFALPSAESENQENETGEVPISENEPRILETMENEPDVLQTTENEPEILQTTENQPMIIQTTENEPVTLQTSEEDPDEPQMTELDTDELQTIASEPNDYQNAEKETTEAQSEPIEEFTTQPSMMVSALPELTKSPDMKPSVDDGQTVLSINAGGDTDIPNSVFGVSKTFTDENPIDGTSDDNKFSTHRFGNSFTYKLKVPKNSEYVLVLSFAESYELNCNTGKRLFSVSIFDDALSEATGQTIEDIDVFSVAGCKTAYTITSKPVDIGESGLINVKFMKKVQQAMISAIDVVASDPNFVRPESSSPDDSVLSSPATNSVVVNVGGPGEIVIPQSNLVKVDKPVTGTDNIPGEFFQTGRYGFNFSYSFKLAPGAYDILLGYAETYQPFCSEPGKRVFNVYVNEHIQQEGFDIFEEAGGCFKGIEVKIPEAAVSAVETKPFTIRFESTANNAEVKYISIKPAKNGCVPASTTGSTGSNDHAAHAVPGTYPPQLDANSPKSYTDNDGDGLYPLRINGDGSHTHFFDPENNIVGIVTNYTWTIVETGEVISREKAFDYKFPLGTTRLKLTVIDNSCTIDEAETTVTITSAVRPGQYCYYYDDLSEIPRGGTLLDKPRPKFAASSLSAALGFPSFPFEDSKFASRCVFFLEDDEKMADAEIELDVHGGIARLYKGEDLIIDTETMPKAKTALPVGLTAFELVYFRTTLSGTPSVNFLVNGKLPSPSRISHDRKSVLPILSTISPPEGNPNGGTRVKITGYGLYPPLTVKFGNVTVPVLPEGATPDQFSVDSPPSDGAASLSITATNSDNIVSNSLLFSYGSTCDNIKFIETLLTAPDGSNYELPQSTTAVIGNDGRIYIGTLGGTVQVLTYNPKTLTTISKCYSKSVTDPDFKRPDGKLASRDILGIAFNPLEDSLSPYVSTSTLHWFYRKRIEESNLGSWRNGAIDRLKPGTDPSDPNICLVYDKRIVSGLPVSNHDHSVNAIQFTQNGDLLIAVGGFTNMGLPQKLLGNYWETTLAGAFLLAKLSKGSSFDGNITYSNGDTPRLSKQISGDVEIYATGVRNPFAMTMTADGNIYAADNGPNCGFGDASISCADYNEEEAAAYKWNVNETWQGSFKFGPQACPYSNSRPDKILHLARGSWYGHPNIQRSESECAWIDPFDHLTADDKPAPSIYKKQMTTVTSPITGIAEYRANHFCGHLRNQLIMSTHKNGTTYNMEVEGGKVLSGPDSLSDTGGTTFVEDAHGQLLFLRLVQQNILVMKPNVTTSESMFVASAVPFRHRKAGGKSIIIGGEKFGSNPEVTIGDKACVVTKSSDTEIMCTVPSGEGGSLVDLVVINSGKNSSLENAVLYMNI